MKIREPVLVEWSVNPIYWNEINGHVYVFVSVLHFFVSAMHCAPQHSRRAIQSGIVR